MAESVGQVDVAAQLPSAASAGNTVNATTAHVGPDNVSVDELRLYRQLLAGAAKRYRRYPALAREQEWEGVADVALTVSASSEKPQIVIVRSSGQAILDNQALEMVSQAARTTTLPKGLKGKDFRVVLPVRFSLEDVQ